MAMNMGSDKAEKPCDKFDPMHTDLLVPPDRCANCGHGKAAHQKQKVN